MRIIDIDGHVREADDLWQRYLEPLLIPPATMVFLSRSKTPPVGRLRVVSLPFEDLRAVS